MKEMDEVKRVIVLLSQWVAAVKISNARGYTDINRVSENLALRLLNTLYDYELENLNWTKGNYPGIDLGCRKTGIAFQVTSQNDWEKITETVEKFFESDEPKNYPQGIRLFLLVEKKRKYQLNRNQTEFLNNSKGFNLHDHIMDISGLAAEIERCYSDDRDRFDNILKLLEDEFGFGEKKIGRRELLEKIFNGSRRYKSNLRGSGGRFRHLDISEIILSPAQQKKRQEFIEAPVRLNDAQDESNETNSLNALEAIPRIWKDDCRHAMLVGEGGMGKTVSLIRLWERLLDDKNFNAMLPVPIFIPLNEFNEQNTDEKRTNFIQKMIHRYYLQGDDRNVELLDILSTPLREDSSSTPSVILLLDGFNEVTIERQQLFIELREIIEHWQGVQIIITSRLDMRSTLNWNDFHLLTLLGLSETSIQNYLDKHKVCLPNSDSATTHQRLLNLLKNPMMLTLYASTCEIHQKQKSNSHLNFKPNVESPGELLWNFTEAQVAKYFTQTGIKDAKKYLYKFLLNHLLPAIGYFMESEGRFELDGKTLKTTIASFLAGITSEEFLDTFPDFDEDEAYLPLGKPDEQNQPLKITEIIKILSKELHMLVKEKSSYRFLHQNFRDFFAAVHILNQTNISLTNNKLSPLLKDTVISFYPRQYIGEIEGEHHNKPYLDSNKIWRINDNSHTLLAQSLELCRNIFDGTTKLAIWNILEIWKKARGEWTGLDFSNLDLSKITINSVICSRPFKDSYLATNFDQSLINSRTIFLQGHSRGVNSAIYSKDRKRILTASRDRKIKEWMTKTGECHSTFHGHNGKVNSAIYSKNKKKILSTSDDGTIKEWDTNSGACIQTLAGHEDCVHSAVYCVDEKKILSASQDKTIKEWDILTGECVTTYNGHSDRVNNAIYSPDGGKILSASDDNTLKEWDVATGTCMRTYIGHKYHVIRATYSTDGKRILSASHDNTIKEWDIVTGECIYTLEGHSKGVNSATYSHDGKKILSASNDLIIMEWDTFTKECIQTLKGHRHSVMSAVYSLGGGKILSASHDDTVKEWDVISGECLQTLNRSSRNISVFLNNREEKNILFISAGYAIKEWNQEIGKCVKALLGHEKSIRTAMYSRDKKKILSASWDNTIRIWDSCTGECIRILRDKSSGINCAVFSESEDKILLALGDSSIKEWEISTGKCLRTLYGHKGPVLSAIYSIDEKKILSASEDKTIKEWDTKTGECIRTFKSNEAEEKDTISTCRRIRETGIRSAIYSFDNKKILSIDWYDKLKEWNTDTGECLNSWKNGDQPKEIAVRYIDRQGNIPRRKSIIPDLLMSDDERNTAKKFTDVPGLWIQGCSFQDLHPDSDLTKNEIKLISTNGAEIISMGT